MPFKQEIPGKVSGGNSAAAKHLVRIETEASELAGGAKLGPVTGEAAGEDAAVVAKAPRVVTKRTNLLCAR